MKSYKIENFQRDSNQAFPRFETLHEDARAELRRSLAARLGIEDDCSNQEFHRQLFGRAHELVGVDAERDEFDLISTMNQYGLPSQQHVYIYWVENEIDRLRLDELSAHFSDIWYPSSDDMAIFDSSLSWVICITHEGEVKLLELT